MRLTEILEPTCVKVPLESKTSETIITELVDLLDARGILSSRDTILEELLLRERTRGSGIGKGVAMPHENSAGVKKLAMAAGIASEPVDFESLDRKPVKIIILVVAPAEQNVQLLQTLNRVKSLVLDDIFMAKIETIRIPEELYEVFGENARENPRVDTER